MKSFGVLPLGIGLAALLITWAINEPAFAENQEKKRIERHIHELEIRLEQARDQGREREVEQLIRQKEEIHEQLRHRDHRIHRQEDRESNVRRRHEETELHAIELELSTQELELEQEKIELEMRHLEATRERMKFRSDPLVGIYESIDLASEHLEPEEAVDVFASLLEKSDQEAIKQHLRLRLIQLCFELDRKGEAIKYLEKTVLIKHLKSENR